MFCQRCGMLKSNCICKIKERRKNRQKSSKGSQIHLKNSVSKIKNEFQEEISDSSTKKSKLIKNTPQKIPISNEINYQIDETPDGVITKEIIEQYCPCNNLGKNQIDILLEIVDAINDGYKYIVLESSPEKSLIALTLANLYESSFILSANDYLQNKFVNDYNFKNNDKFYISNHITALKEFKNHNKRKLLIIEDAHRLDENIVNSFSLTIDLDDYDEDFLSKFNPDIKALPNNDYNLWIEFIKYLSLDSDESEIIIDYIKRNSENWVCEYNSYSEFISFMPLNVGIFLNEFLLNKVDFCIFISPAILNVEKFVEEFDIEVSQVKFIHNNIFSDLNKNKIFARNSVDMADKKHFNHNKWLLINIIDEILNKHENDKGIIHINSSLKSFIRNQFYSTNRLIIRTTDNELERFNESKNSVLVTDKLLECGEVPQDCKFQIILKQHLGPWNERAKTKDNESGWYDYRKAIDLVQQLVNSTNDSFITYWVDESLFRFILIDVMRYQFIPEYILNLIVDRSYIDEGYISDNIMKKYGVCYLHDYVPDNRGISRLLDYDSKTIKLSDDIQKYKDYEKDNFEDFIQEFNFFTKEFMKVICEFSNQIVSEEVDKLALIAIPSSTLERDKVATVRESINCIEKCYKGGLLQSVYNCEKEIINCNDLLTRCSNVDTSHLDDRRPCYSEHMNSIKCEVNKLLKREDVAFIILDDISTRGTIMDACEDILINNGVNKDHIYKFALFKTIW